MLSTSSEWQINKSIGFRVRFEMIHAILNYIKSSHGSKRKKEKKEKDLGLNFSSALYQPLNLNSELQVCYL